MTFIMQENFFTVREPRRGRKQNANQLLLFFPSAAWCSGYFHCFLFKNFAGVAEELKTPRRSSNFLTSHSQQFPSQYRIAAFAPLLSFSTSRSSSISIFKSCASFSALLRPQCEYFYIPSKIPKSQTDKPFSQDPSKKKKCWFGELKEICKLARQAKELAACREYEFAQRRNSNTSFVILWTKSEAATSI